MVTTRRQNEPKAAPIQNQSIDAELVDPDVSSGSSKRRRNLQTTPDPASDDNEGQDAHDEDEEKIATPTRKKQKKLPTRNKDEDHFRSRSHIEIVIPVKDIVEMDRTNQTAVNQQGSSREEEGSAGENTMFAIGQPEEERPPMGSGDLNKTTRQTTEDESIPRGIYDKEANVLRKRVPKANEASASSPLPAAATANSGKPKHRRFGSEELSVDELEEVPEEAHQQLQDEDESSGDDAPEIIARPDAQEKARQSAKNAAKAAEERDAIIRQKRKVQDVRLKTQAKTAGKKRKRGGNVDAERAASHPLNQEEGSKSVLRDILADPLSKASKSKLPQFLPLEYLEDDNPSPAFVNKIPIAAQKLIGKGKKTKFFDSGAKRPKDLVRGSTTYRVAEAHGDGLLAPKAVPTARGVKEAWLRGRAGKWGRPPRRPMNKGFLVQN